MRIMRKWGTISIPIIVAHDFKVMLNLNDIKIILFLPLSIVNRIHGLDF